LRAGGDKGLEPTGKMAFFGFKNLCRVWGNRGEGGAMGEVQTVFSLLLKARGSRRYVVTKVVVVVGGGGGDDDDVGIAAVVVLVVVVLVVLVLLVKK